ncbi:MAG: CvpA family protein [Sedimentisphaerales bacterium]
MPNLIIIAVGLVFALIGYRKTWYPSWTCLFNLLIAVYVSIMIAPQVVDKIPLIRSYLDDYSYAVFALAVAVVIFVVMNLFSFRYFTSASTVPFPKILDSVGAAVLGFLTGSLIVGFLLFLITITPLSHYSFVKSVAQGKQPDACGNYVVIASCSLVHDISLQPIPDAIEKQLELIINGWNESVGKAKDTNNLPDSNTIEPPKSTGAD